MYLFLVLFWYKKQCILHFRNLYLAAGVHFIATKINELLAISFVYPLLVSAAKTALTALAIAANLHHFGTKNSAFYL